MATTALIILSTLVLSAFFSGMEIAFVSANRFRVEIDRKKGDLSAGIIGRFMDSPTRFISAMLVGNNIALVVYGIVMAQVLEPPIRSFVGSAMVVMVVQTALSTMLILVVAEFVPKAVFRADPNGMLRLFAIPAQVLYWLLTPVVWATETFSRQVLVTFFKVKMNEEKISFGRSDLDNLVSEQTEQPTTDDSQNELKIFRNALAFSEVKVRECMIPRTEMVCFDVDGTVADLHRRFVETGLSKIIIYRDNHDNIVGYVHSFEMFQRPTSIRSVVRPLSFVPETMRAQDLLTQFGVQQRSMAVVVDEFGGTAGLITVEDIIEEIFGEIDDEHDVEELTDRRVNEREFVLSGRLEIDRLNERYNLGLELSDEYETLGGFIIAHHQSIPQKDENITIGRYGFTILAMNGTRIDQVRLRLLD